MFRFIPILLGAVLLSALPSPDAGADEAATARVRDLYFGEALYQAYQGRYFEALERLDTELGQYYGLDEPQLNSLHIHIGQAEFSVGDFELYYRMHHRAGRAIKAVLDGNVDEPTRNEAAFRLARIHFQKDQPQEALHALERIEGTIPDTIKEDVEFLRANVYMALLRPADAVAVLKRAPDGGELAGFSAYNLGIALLQEGRERDALLQLEHAGQIKAADPASRAIRDKSNMVLGKLMFEASDFDRSQRSFDRVRLEGPYSNQALLNAGWADVSAQNFERAVVPWGLLAKRETTDSAVQEAMLALPFAYSKLNVHGRAALLYGQALQTFGGELEKVDASIEAIKAGKFLQALVREEIQQDPEWVVRLRSLPEAPETFYLTTLLASHDFQTALQNYLDLEHLRKKMLTWEVGLSAFEDIIGVRRQNYEPLLPQIDAQFRELDSQIRLRTEQREHLDRRLQGLLTAPRPELLASAEERMVLQRLRDIEQSLADSQSAEMPALRQRVERLRGALIWTLRTQYHERLTQAHTHLRELNAVIATMMAQYTAFVRSRQAALHSYTGYDLAIAELRRRIDHGLQSVNVLMNRQGLLIEKVAIAELQTRRERLVSYQTHARYAVADSYDRATKIQALGPAGGAQ